MCLSADLPHHSNNVVGIKMWFHPRQELLMLILMMAALWQLGYVWHCSHFSLIRHLTQALLLLSSLEYCNEVDTSSWGKIALWVIFDFHLYVQIYRSADISKIICQVVYHFLHYKRLHAWDKVVYFKPCAVNCANIWFTHPKMSSFQLNDWSLLSCCHVKTLRLVAVAT